MEQTDSGRQIQEYKLTGSHFFLIFSLIIYFYSHSTTMTNEVIDEICLGSHRGLIEAPETRTFYKRDDSWS